MRTVIKVDDLSMSFGEERVLQSVSCEFQEGLIYGIVGNNGSGKTVLMKCICGFLVPTSGYVEVDSKRIGKDIDFPEDIGIIIETPGFLPNLTGVKNLEMLASLQGKIGTATVRDAIRKVGLDPGLKKPVAKYSLGMRQRLGIAQAIMEDPAILILDEPFNGLDKRGVAQIHELILGLKSHNKTILLSSHSQYDIDVLCDVVYEMDAGEMKCIRGLENNVLIQENGGDKKQDRLNGRKVEGKERRAAVTEPFPMLGGFSVKDYLTMSLGEEGMEDGLIKIKAVLEKYGLWEKREFKAEFLSPEERCYLQLAMAEAQCPEGIPIERGVMRTAKEENRYVESE